MYATESYPSKGAPVALPPVTAFSNASNALEEARQLAFRVEDLVNKLCGSQPQEAANPSKQGSASVLSGLRDEAERTTEAVRRAVGQLNRLDRELPS